MKKSKSYIFAILGLGIIPLFFLMGFTTRYILRNYGVYTTGIVTKAPISRGGPTIYYEFYSGGEKYMGKIPYPNLYSDVGREFIGKSFPVVYYPKSPRLNSICITPTDFKHYSEPFPDSLNWVLKYIRD